MEKRKFPDTPFTVNVVSGLNVRSEGSMSGTIKGQTGKGTFTIVQVKNGWGKLKSGLGWIFLENESQCKINNPPKDYEKLGKQLETCLNDIKNLTSYKKLKDLL